MLIFLIINFFLVIITEEWILSLIQPHKTGSIRWGLHPLIYYERLSSLVDVGSPTVINIFNIFFHNFYYIFYI